MVSGSSVKTPWKPGNRCFLSDHCERCNFEYFECDVSYLEIGASGVSLHDGEDQPSTIPCNEKFVGLVLGEYRKSPAASFQAFDVP